MEIRFKGLGIGTCTHGFEKNLPGCPPKAKDIIDFLMDNVD